MAYLLSIEWQYNGKVMDYTYLVGGSGHFLYFHILGIIIPTDFHIFQRGRSTTNQIYYNGNIWQIPVKLSFESSGIGVFPSFSDPKPVFWGSTDPRVSS